MVTALLVLLGIPIWFVIILVGLTVLRHKWLSSRPGGFTCAARLTSGNTDLIGSKWKRGIGRWERDVFVFANVPSVYSFTTVAVDQLSAADVRRATKGEVRRMGESPLVYPFLAASGVSFELAVDPECASLAAGTFPVPAMPKAQPGATATADPVAASRPEPTS